MWIEWWLLEVGVNTQVSLFRSKVCIDFLHRTGLSEEQSFKFKFKFFWIDNGKNIRRMATNRNLYQIIMPEVTSRRKYKCPLIQFPSVILTLEVSVKLVFWKVIHLAIWWRPKKSYFALIPTKRASTLNGLNVSHVHKCI